MISVGAVVVVAFKMRHRVGAMVNMLEMTTVTIFAPLLSIESEVVAEVGMEELAAASFLSLHSVLAVGVEKALTYLVNRSRTRANAAVVHVGIGGRGMKIGRLRRRR